MESRQYQTTNAATTWRVHWTQQVLFLTMRYVHQWIRNLLLLGASRRDPTIVKSESAVIVVSTVGMLTWTSTTSGVTMRSRMSCAMRSPSFTAIEHDISMHVIDHTMNDVKLTCEVLVGEVEEQDEDDASIVCVDDARPGVDHEFGR